MADTAPPPVDEGIQVFRKPPKVAARIALIGNPNTGKSTLFNNLTGLRQRTGNYPGVTVYGASGQMPFGEGQEAEVLDLPGTYSLSATSIDERVVVDALLGRAGIGAAPNLIVALIDATNLTRNLFLACQLADLGIPMVLALNFADSARKKGIEIDALKLASRLNVPVVPIVAARDEGLDALKTAIRKQLDERHTMRRIVWPEPIRAATDLLRERLPKAAADTPEAQLRRMLFDAGPASVEAVPGNPDCIRKALKEAREVLFAAGLNPHSAEAVTVYRQLRDLTAGTVLENRPGKTSESESIDKLLTHRFWGLGIFAALMYGVFFAVYTGAGPFMDFIDGLTGAAQGWAGDWLEGAPALQSLVTDGIIGGVGGVIIFLPQILILFAFIALLEDSGYMARAAFLMDKLFGWCGLSGKSFVPLLSSYACAIPGIMATRTIQDPKARLVTILIAPLMSCSARLPVYVLLIGAFIEPLYGAGIAGLVLFIMHFIGLLVAVPVALVLNRFILKTPPQPFILEMPDYQPPRLKNVLLRMYQQGREFIVKAGTVIVAFTIVIWALLYFPRPPELAERETEAFIAERATQTALTPEQARAQLAEDADWQQRLDNRINHAYMEQSLMGRAGRAIQPIFDPAGFDWKITVGVLSSFPAREVIISTLGVIYNLGGDVDEESSDLRSALRDQTWQSGQRAGQPIFTIPVVLSILVFFALCQQCASTLAVIAQQTHWRWAVVSFVYMTALAWLAAVLVYQLGSAIA
ncbi:MAG: ferrous iron transport protein B [Verrucomicrobiota bacterium]